MTFRSSSERLPVLRFMMFEASDYDDPGPSFIGSCDSAEEAWSWRSVTRIHDIYAVIDLETGQFIARPTALPPILESDDDFRRRLIKDARSIVVNNLMTATGRSLDDLARRYFSPAMTRKVIE